MVVYICVAHEYDLRLSAQQLPRGVSPRRFGTGRGYPVRGLPADCQGRNFAESDGRKLLPVALRHLAI